eukprot:TRINITY_DN11916_c0_g1_i1.p1 TRINITY_DN11916_c0_g1~~TRINITY_DN11916_c0_g1_i1.p1  ORF type:complete len:276 (+),score=61.40 TRINITY_DN11916_c0_g1_i1:22-849(+)
MLAFPDLKFSDDNKNTGKFESIKLLQNNKLLKGNSGCRLLPQLEENQYYYYEIIFATGSYCGGGLIGKDSNLINQDSYIWFNKECFCVVSGNYLWSRSTSSYFDFETKKSHSYERVAHKYEFKNDEFYNRLSNDPKEAFETILNEKNSLLRLGCLVDTFEKRIYYYSGSKETGMVIIDKEFTKTYFDLPDFFACIGTDEGFCWICEDVTAPSEFPEELSFLLKWDKKNYKFLPQSKKQEIYTFCLVILLLNKKRFTKYPIPKVMCNEIIQFVLIK